MENNAESAQANSPSHASTASHTPGPWRWTRVDYDHTKLYSLSNYKEHPSGPFDAIWSDATNGPVAVAQDASSYEATFDFPNDGDAHLIAAAPSLYELACAVAEQFENTDAPLGTRAREILGAINAIAKAGGRHE